MASSQVLLITGLTPPPLPPGGKSYFVTITLETLISIAIRNNEPIACTAYFFKLSCFTRNFLTQRTFIVKKILRENQGVQQQLYKTAFQNFEILSGMVQAYFRIKMFGLNL